jgi:putative membrane-bound dehydrogenase-like protein
MRRVSSFSNSIDRAMKNPSLPLCDASHLISRRSIRRHVTVVALLLIAQLAKADDFPQLPNTEKSKIPFTTPEQALKALKVPKGFKATMFAAEPDVNQPIALATDERGRLWVCENYTYDDRTIGFANEARDRIVILEDYDHDGTFDERKVFWDAGRRLTSVEIGYGGVWVLDAPRLLFIPDANKDDKPDGEPQVVLDGWNDGAVRHNIVNGLRWGPDGWLYGRHGILATSYVGPPGASRDQRTPINCGIWRVHPIKKTFEVVCHGTTNPWGMDWDTNGQMFFINTVIGHLWHVIPGAHYRRMYGEHFNPNTYQVIEQTADHFHWDTKENWSDIRKLGVTKTTDAAGGGHAHSGMVILQNSTWPKSLFNTVMTVNLHGRRLNVDSLERHGCGYVAKHGDDFAKTSDPWFRGVELHVGRYGELYLADWSDVGECHENDGVHRTSGRIFRITYNNPNAPISKTAQISDFSVHSSMALVRMLDGKNEWESRTIRRLLAEQAAAGTDVTEAARHLVGELTKSRDRAKRLRALWTLHAMGKTNNQILMYCLEQKDEHLRAWAVKLFVDHGTPDDKTLEHLASMVADEQSGLVLTNLASAMGRLPLDKRWALATPLAKRIDHKADDVLPLMIWYGIEPAVTSNQEAAIRLIGSNTMPLLREFTVRRLTQELDRFPDAVSHVLTTLGRNIENKQLHHDVLAGMSNALRGWQKAPAPKGWARISEILAKAGNDDVQRQTRELSLVFGDGRAMSELQEIAFRAGRPLPERRSAIRALVMAKAETIVPDLQKLLRDRDLAVSAINGLAAFSHAETPKLLVIRYGGFRNPAKREAINTLVSRATYAKVLLDSIADKKLTRDAVSAFQIRQVQSFRNDALSKQVAAIWPELKEQAAAKSKRIADLKKSLTNETLEKADRSAGRLLFSKSCANCHTLFGEGKKVAPDLTGAQRSNLSYLLENIVDPSATVSKNFKMSIVEQIDGRIFNGVIVERTPKTYTIQTADKKIVFPKSSVEMITESELSMMPENLLNVLNDEQVRDLIAYLMSPAQVPLPKAEKS